MSALSPSQFTPMPTALQNPCLKPMNVFASVLRARPKAIFQSMLSLRPAGRTGAQAVHPASGFLSENASFARVLDDAGVSFIGPRPEHLELFGLKNTAREVAQSCGVPLLPGSALLENAATALREAERIGYPVMLKNVGGEGGIGIAGATARKPWPRGSRPYSAPPRAASPTPASILSGSSKAAWDRSGSTWNTALTPRADLKLRI
jgi:hypothetical protein